MAQMNLITRLVLLCFVSLIFCQCNQDDALNQDNSSRYEEIQKLEPAILQFLENSGSEGKSLCNPTNFEVGIRVVGSGLFRDIDNVQGCLLANTNYELIFSIPTSGSNSRACACLDIHRNGILGSGEPRLCKDTRIISDSGCSYKFVLYNFKTPNMGQFVFSAISGCNNTNSPDTSFGTELNYMRRICNMYDL